MNRLAIVALLVALPAAAQAPRLAPGEVLEGRFVQERAAADAAAPLRSEGRFTLVPERGLVWRIEKPVSAATAITPGGLAQAVEGGAVTRVPADRVAVLARLPLMIASALAGDWAPLESAFAVERRGDAGAWTISLTPRGDAPISEILVTGSKLVDAVEIRRRDGGRDRMLFEAQSVRAGPPAAEDAALLEAAGP